MSERISLKMKGFCLLILIVAPLWMIGCGQGKKDMNVLVISMDTTRADRIGAYGYQEARTPNIDALAGNGILFQDTITPAPLTLPAHCSLFTGTIPLYHKVRNNGSYFLPDGIDTMAELFKRDGYLTAAFISSFTLDSRFRLDQGFDIYSDDVVLDERLVKSFSSERPADLVFADFASWFEKNSSQKFFSWVHFYDPHLPYAPPEPYKSRFPDEPYDGEIAYMDEYIGKIITLLKERGVYDNTLIVLAGDHGEAFGEHGEVGHQIFCYEENIRVPLIFVFPGTEWENIKITRQVGLIDMMPTVLDYLGYDVPSHIQGDSLLPVISNNRPMVKKRPYYIESVFARESLGCAAVRGVVYEEYKYLDLPQPELYNLESDPFETMNLADQDPAKCWDLKNELFHIIDLHRKVTFKSQRTLSRSERQQLESLGYLVSSGQEAKGDLPDPKDRIHAWSVYLEANDLYSRGKAEEAIPVFLKAIEENPHFSWSYSKLAYIYYSQGDPQKAAHWYKAGISANPGDYILRIDYVNLLISQSEFYEAFEILKELKKLNPLDAGAQVENLMAKIFEIRGEYREAIKHYRRVLEIEPENFEVKKKMGFFHQRIGEHREALEIFVQLEEKIPDDFDLMFNLAMVYGLLKRYPESFRYFEKAAAINPKPVVFFDHAAILANAGKFAEAIEKMRKFLEKHPQEDATRKQAIQSIEMWKQF